MEIKTLENIGNSLFFPEMQESDKNLRKPTKYKKKSWIFVEKGKK